MTFRLKLAGWVVFAGLLVAPAAWAQEDEEPEATCLDGEQNQDESDVDCGGVCGANCLVGAACGGNTDCQSGACRNNICFNPVRCGDRNLDIGEECDDGNLNDGDGCSAQCTIEPGWTCSLESGCSWLDTDGDGLPDWFEFEIGTNHEAVDTDGDGYSDTREWAAGSDPLDPESTPFEGNCSTVSGQPAAWAGLLAALLGVLAWGRRRTRVARG